MGNDFGVDVRGRCVIEQRCCGIGVLARFIGNSFQIWFVCCIVDQFRMKTKTNRIVKRERERNDFLFFSFLFSLSENVSIGEKCLNQWEWKCYLELRDEMMTFSRVNIIILIFTWNFSRKRNQKIIIIWCSSLINILSPHSFSNSICNSFLLSISNWYHE